MPDVSNPGGSCPVIAVRSITKTDTQSTTTIVSTSWTDVTGLSITHTPSSASNKVLVRAVVQVGYNSALNSTVVRLVRGSTAICVGDASGSRSQIGASAYDADPNGVNTCVIEILDTPATTSSTTWKVQFGVSNPSGTSYINRSHTNTDSIIGKLAASTLTIMEVTP